MTGPGQGTVPVGYAGRLSPPHLTTVVSRERLLKAITGAVATGQVCEIVAPGGTGKTTLVAEWAQHASLPVAWYQLDVTDRDPRRLVQGMAHAINRVLPGLLQHVLRASTGTAPAPRLLRQLLHALDGQRLVLVFDDLQHSTQNQEVRALFDQLLQQKPSTLALIFLARGRDAADSHFSKEKRQSQQWLTLEDIRFHASEATALLEAYGLAQPGVAFLTRRSNGIAAELLLLAHAQIHQSGLPSMHQAAEGIIPEQDSDTRASTFLASISPMLRTFVLDTAPLGSLTARDADAILGRRESALWYAQVVQQLPFVECVDDTYRYQEVFAEYLIEQLQAENPQRLQALRHAGAIYWQELKELPRALTLLEATQDWEQVAMFLDRHRYTLWDHNLWGTILAGISRLPMQYLSARLVALAGRVHLERGEDFRAWNRIAEGFELIRQHDKSSDAWLHPALLELEALWRNGRDHQVIEKSDAARDKAQRLGHQNALARIQDIYGRSLLRSGRVHEGREEMLAAVAFHHATRDIRNEVRVLLNLATRLLEIGRAIEGEKYLLQAEALIPQQSDRTIEAHTIYTRALLYALRGERTTTYVTATTAKTLSEELGYTYLECLATALLAELAAETGAEDAARMAEDARNFAEQVSDPTARATALRVQIVAALVHHEYTTAEQLLTQARKPYHAGEVTLETTPIDAALLDLLEGTLALAKGDAACAYSILRKAGPKLDGLHQPHHAARSYLLLAEALLAQEQPTQAGEVLQYLPELVVQRGCAGYLSFLVPRIPRVVSCWRELQGVDQDTKELLEKIIAMAPAPSLVPQYAYTLNGL